MKVVVTTHRRQNRKHHKKRINKKWAKRYGFTETEVQEKGTMLCVPSENGDNILYVTYADFCRLKSIISIANKVHRVR